MKKLTLDKTWELCLAQWKWIVGQIRKGRPAYIGDLKGEWLVKHGFENTRDSAGNCFFCRYAGGDVSGGIDEKDCIKCPARKVDKAFYCCNADYDYAYKPLAFYAKLLKLNKIRLAKKKAKK